MSNSTIFLFEGNDVLVTEDENGSLWFAANEICSILGISNAKRALAKLSHFNVDTFLGEDVTGKKQPIKLIDETAIYKLMILANVQTAKRLYKWITSKVHPVYGVEEDIYEPSDPFEIPRTFTEALWLCASLQAEKESDEYKVEAYDKYLHVEEASTMEEVATSLDMTPDELADFLKEREIFNLDDMPNKQYIDAELFLIQTISLRGSLARKTTNLLITNKGVNRIKKLLEDEANDELLEGMKDDCCLDDL
ncbi:MAG: phage antirepressor KilAC domain-containing protein [Candidatus Brocadiaceae bacterium]|nr:phage antirepressor KilAC domain-containing protein [Candidatus Brocadiaceae bacterium]